MNSAKSIIYIKFGTGNSEMPTERDNYLPGTLTQFKGTINIGYYP